MALGNEDKPTRDVLPGPSGPLRRRLKLKSLSKTSEIRRIALLKLRTTVLFDPSASQLGLSLMRCAGSLVDESEISRSFQDAFAVKASSTFEKRAGALWRFCTWDLKSGIASPLKASEADLYRYLIGMQDDEKSPTSVNAFLEAWRFLDGVAKLTEPATFSSRCVGLARSELAKKGSLKQALPLTAEAVWALEQKLCDDGLSKDTVILGHIWFTLSRWADTRWLEGVTSAKSKQLSLIESGT